MKQTIDGTALVYAAGAFNTPNGKTAHGLVRFTERYEVIGVIDHRYEGQDAGTVLDRKKKGIPIYKDLEQAVKAVGIPDSLVIGLAPDGGRLPAEARSVIKEALKMGMNVDSGLHDFLYKDDQIMELATAHHCRVRDIRRSPDRDELHFFTGKIEEVDCLNVAILGTDSAIGKRTTAWIIVRAFRKAGRKAIMVGTGQTSWMQGARYSMIMDSCVNDFVSGEIEHAVHEAWKNEHPDLIVIEGQGSLMNPAYPGGFEILAAGRPDYVIIQHAPKRVEYDGFPGYPLHPINEQIRAIETISGKKVIAVTVNHEDMQPEEILPACAAITKETGLPAFDVLEYGADELVQLTNYFAEMIKQEAFIVLRKLSVGNLQISPRQVKAEYVVERMTGETAAIELIYSYDHPYFKPSDPGDVNLASMMAAQVALNYGLFCETIEMDGLYDKTDRRFLEDMLENTSREILTNKLLTTNDFLKAPYNSLSPEKRDRYTKARLVFTNTKFQGLKNEKESRTSDPGKYAILSSGGKDSLLTYGIISEIGEAFPVFINEAGRHWFTAVNAHRHFKAMEPNTSKPWCNSDRVFNWMVRQLPFIRQDYASIRADYYPVRLWTVAVFLFGVLPIVLKKGIGNVLIGDEYDSTMTGNLEGISHYQGLYDQSKYFDNSLSRYYRSKGWPVVQFSLLRSLSELLIMKILVKRYPELQRQQVSCHAAHEVDGRMHPCGNCEKCRRIIGMLMALDEDPGRCGYTASQIEKGLRALEKRSVKQLGSDAAHLYHLLLERGIIARTPHTAKLAKPHPQITKLRFDAERSNLEDLPSAIRKPLFRILGKYADGSVQRKDGRWVDIDLSDAFLEKPIYKIKTK